MKVADGHLVDVVGKVTAPFTLEGLITRLISFYVMKGNTPFAALLGIPGLNAFHATADFRASPTTYQIRQTKSGQGVNVTRDEAPKTKDLDRLGIRKVGSRMRSPSTTNSAGDDSSGDESEDELMDKANVYATRASRERKVSSRRMSTVSDSSEN